jgi:hypothetical protein
MLLALAHQYTTPESLAQSWNLASKAEAKPQGTNHRRLEKFEVSTLLWKEEQLAKVRRCSRSGWLAPLLKVSANKTFQKTL